MATAPTSRRLNLTRDQLATFLTDQQQIRQFELLFSTVDQIQVIVGTDFEYQADNAAATANEALASLSALAQETAVTNAALEAKIQQALDAIPRLAQALELLAAAPVIENNNSVVTDYIDLSESPAPTSKTRRLAWNTTDQTVNLGMDYGVTQQIGQETYARVGNTTGSTILNGTVVGFAGATSNALLVAPYLADGSQPTLYILGVMTHDLPDSGQKGYCTTWGFVRDMNTSAFSPGDLLYASPTVAGALTNIKPTAPDNVIPLASCITSNATTGVIFVRPTIQQMQYYGVFTKTTDQTPAVINTEYLLTFDNTQISNGVTIGGTTSRIIVPESGLYQFDATVQLTSGSSSSKNIWVWWKKNGTAIANSARLVTSDVNNGYIPIALNETVSLAANEYVELAFAADSTNVTVDSVAATAFAPAAPAVVLSVTQVQQ
jgi:hypothetical protein